MTAQISIFRFLTLLSFFFLSLVGASQERYTPYDECPGIIKSYKPGYQNDFPNWAKMLYQYPVNFHEISDEFTKFNKEDSKNLKPIIRYYKLWSRKISPWVLEDGTIVLPDLEAFYQKRKTEQLHANFSTKTESNWTFVGPKETFWLNESDSPETPLSCPWQVNIYSFDVANTNTDVMYCGTETGFVNKSIDEGISWEIMGIDYSFGGGITSVAIDPTNENIVYAAAGNQIHKSTNGGIVWEPLLANSALFYADKLIIDETNPSKIIGCSTNGIYVTADAGSTWSNAWSIATYDVAFLEGNSDVIYGLTHDSNNFSLIRSVDGGESFQVQSSFPDNIIESNGGLLATTPDDPNKLMALMLSDQDTPYLYQYNISEDTWQLQATGQTDELELNNGQGYYDLVLEISPIDANLIYAGTTTLFKSTDGGENFSVIGGYYGDFAIHPDVQDMKVLANGNTWLATDGGLTKTTDNYINQNNFTSLTNGIIGSDMWGFDQGWNEDLMVGGRYHNGNTAVADYYQDKALRMGGAESPTGWVLKGRTRHVAFNDLGNGWILPTTAEGAPEGRFIFSKYPNMDEYGGRRGNLVFHPNYYGEIYLGEDDFLWKSTDMGMSYDLLYEFENRVMLIQMSYSNPEVMYADIKSRGFYRSDDGGITWEHKESLTSWPNGSTYWEGKLHFVISPTDENTIYACLQNGLWTTDTGEIFRSTDGGNTWEDWTGNLSEYTKNLVIQPDSEGNDLVYLFTNADNGETAKVYQRAENETAWTAFDAGYPRGVNVILALPFFRDSKIRMAGTAGFWESPMAVEDFSPLVNPWVEKKSYNCMTDTLYFDDHSILNHENVTWQWEFSPEPIFVEDYTIRNPKVVLGNTAVYDVTLTITKDGESFSKTINEMVSATTCPSIDDCSNPTGVPKDIWELVSVDSEEVNDPGLATMAFDDDPNTIWHTAWSTGSTPYPHEIQVDMGVAYHVSRFVYLPRQNGQNGRIKEYELYITEDLSDWGESVSVGEFENSSAFQTIELSVPKNGRYWKLVCLSEVNGGPWSSAAEFDVIGCTDLNTNINQELPLQEMTVYPMPMEDEISVSIPTTGKITYYIYSIEGKVIQSGKFENSSNLFSLSVEDYIPGIYLLKIVDQSNREYRMKMIKK